jgi:CBS domain-containing protein
MRAHEIFSIPPYGVQRRRPERAYSRKGCALGLRRRSGCVPERRARRGEAAEHVTSTWRSPCWRSFERGIAHARSRSGDPRTVRGAEADVRHLPVTSGGALVGIVSDRDLREVVPSALDVVARPRDAARILARPISDVMSSDVVSVSPGDDLVEAIDLMIKHRIGAIPVVDASSDELVGIVSYVDALRAARESLAVD